MENKVGIFDWTAPDDGKGRRLPRPTDALPIIQVGEDEERFPGVFTSVAGENVVFIGRREKVDLEILEVTLQPLAATALKVQVSGHDVTANWTLAQNQPWSSPGFILLAGQYIAVIASAVGVVVNFEIRWRLYYGRQV